MYILYILYNKSKVIPFILFLPICLHVRLFLLHKHFAHKHLYELPTKSNCKFTVIGLYGRTDMYIVVGGKGVSTYSVLACFLLFVCRSWLKLFHVHCSHYSPRTLFLEIIISRTLFSNKIITCTLFLLSPYFSVLIVHFPYKNRFII